MDHSEFVEKYNSQVITVTVDENKAGFMFQKNGPMPQHLRLKQANKRTLFYGGIITGIALFFFVPWWVATAVLIFALYQGPKAQKHAAESVLEQALKEPNIYRTAIESQVIRIE